MNQQTIVKQMEKSNNNSIGAVWQRVMDYHYGMIYGKQVFPDGMVEFKAVDGYDIEYLLYAEQVIATKKIAFTDNQAKNIINIERLTADYESMLLSWLRTASESQFSDGMKWYAQAKETCETLAEKHDKKLETVIAIVSALSPGCPWDRNVADAQEVLLNGFNAVSCATYKSNVKKAAKIAETENTSILSGVKVEAFYDSILNPQTAVIACIDRWMLRAVNITQRGSLRVGERKALQRAFENISKEHDIPVASLQAIVWIVVREHHNGSVRGLGFWSGGNGF
jgi:hypothetical protein